MLLILKSVDNSTFPCCIIFLMKRFFLALFLLTFFFSQSSTVTFSIEPSEEGTTQTNTGSGDAWNDFWASVGDFFANLFSSSYVPNRDPTVADNSQELTRYNSNKQDSNSRTMSGDDIAFSKGVYLKNSIENKDSYKDDIIGYVCNGVCANKGEQDDTCTPIKKSTLVYYYKTKNIPVLYDANNPNQAINYDSINLEDQELINDDSCYTNLYESLPVVPVGRNESNQNVVGASSKQLNNAFRTPVSYSEQEGDLSDSDNTSTDSAKNIATDNQKQEVKMMSAFVPQSNYSDSETSDSDVLAGNISTESLRDDFKDWLHPASWQRNQGDTPERGDWDIAGGCTSNRDPSSCNAVKSHCRGMSQYGALGLAQSGESYEDILKFYYGNITLKTIDSENMSVEIELDDSDSCPSGSSLNVEDYLKGLGEMPDYWGNSSKGGYEALKAQVVAARTYAYVRTNKFTEPICNSSRCQVFRCSNIGAKPNLTKAVEDTMGQIVVDATNESAFSTEYARSFCGPSRAVVCPEHSNPSVDGFEYEIKANGGQPKSCK